MNERFVPIKDLGDLVELVNDNNHILDRRIDRLNRKVRVCDFCNSLVLGFGVAALTYTLTTVVKLRDRVGDLQMRVADLEIRLACAKENTEESE